MSEDTRGQWTAAVVVSAIIGSVMAWLVTSATAREHPPSRHVATVINPGSVVVVDERTGSADFYLLKEGKWVLVDFSHDDRAADAEASRGAP